MVQVLILAAGKGTRMGGDWPKALTPLRGRPIIEYLLDNIIPVCPKPIVVVGYKGEDVIRRLGNDRCYAWQTEQLGTGHAALCAEPQIRSSAADDIVVLYGDHPLVTSQTVIALAEIRARTRSVMAMCTVVLPSFDGDFAAFRDWGRILRSAAGEIVGLVEAKDATSDQLSLTEVNPSFFCFEPEWLLENLRRIGKINANGEYYLTDLVNIAIAQKQRVSSIRIDSTEAMGANTLEEVAFIERLVYPVT
jgi:bifunctional UDP-N-acetylglucosamine pyrophosphorylase/glucosamine-1-phosphate N-acetyltransferase